MRRCYADLAHGQVHYREAGSGQPLLLLHQTASSSAMYERLAPLLADRFRIIAPDTPGFGLSDPLPSQPSIGDYARVMAELVGQLDLGPLPVVGFHTGSHIALELAAASPALVQRVAMIGVLAVKDKAERDEWYAQIVKPWTPDWDGKFLESHLKLLQSYTDPSDHEGMWLELTQRLLAGPNYWHAYAAVLDHDSLAAARSLTMPSLYVNPTGDMLIPQTKLVHAATPGAAYAEIEGGADVVMMNPAAVAAVVRDFCA